MNKYSLNGKWDLYYFKQEQLKHDKIADLENASENKVKAIVPEN